MSDAASQPHQLQPQPQPQPSVPGAGVQLSTAFDSGNARLLAPIPAPDADGRVVVRLAIVPDHDSRHYQWFHLRLSGVRGMNLELRFENAATASYPQGWVGYRAVASVDRQTWTRVDTSVQDGQLVIHHRPATDAMSYAYFAPYSVERHLDLIGASLATGSVRHDVLGLSLDGRQLDHLTLGQGPRVLWMIGRQHPGESMASWWMEGFLHRLLDTDDALARLLLDRATLHIVPMMNPDGATRGHLRTNACGANLNREWHQPTVTRSPEVKCVRDAMDTTGVDLCLDVHGDEGLPYNFLSGAEGTPGWSPRLAALQDHLAAAYQRANPDLQRTHGYSVDAAGEGNMSMCTNQISQRFDCLSLTLEMPFKDNANAPDPICGWSPVRSQRLGASAVDALAAVVSELR